MSSNIDSISDLREVERIRQTHLGVVDSTVRRLITEAFERPERAIPAVLTIIRFRGAEEAIRILTETTVERYLHCGTTRETILVRGSGARVRSALAELPQAIRDRQELVNQLADIRAARIRALEREDADRRNQERATTPTRGRPRSRGRG